MSEMSAKCVKLSVSLSVSLCLVCLSASLSLRYLRLQLDLVNVGVCLFEVGRPVLELVDQCLEGGFEHLRRVLKRKDTNGVVVVNGFVVSWFRRTSW